MNNMRLSTTHMPFDSDRVQIECTSKFKTIIPLFMLLHCQSLNSSFNMMLNMTQDDPFFPCSLPRQTALSLTMYRPSHGCIVSSSAERARILTILHRVCPRWEGSTYLCMVQFDFFQSSTTWRIYAIFPKIMRKKDWYNLYLSCHLRVYYCLSEIDWRLSCLFSAHNLKDVGGG